MLIISLGVLPTILMNVEATAYPDFTIEHGAAILFDIDASVLPIGVAILSETAMRVLRRTS